MLKLTVNYVDGRRANTAVQPSWSRLPCVQMRNRCKSEKKTPPTKAFAEVNNGHEYYLHNSITVFWVSWVFSQVNVPSLFVHI